MTSVVWARAISYAYIHTYVCNSILAYVTKLIACFLQFHFYWQIECFRIDAWWSLILLPCEQYPAPSASTTISVIFSFTRTSTQKPPTICQCTKSSVAISATRKAILCIELRRTIETIGRKCSWRVWMQRWIVCQNQNGWIAWIFFSPFAWSKSR